MPVIEVTEYKCITLVVFFSASVGLFSSFGWKNF